MSVAESSMQWSQPFRHMEFPEILEATANFDESLVIGRGGFGKVYKGEVISGSSLVVAAIKRLDPKSSQGPAEFWAEVKTLSKLRHCNIVPLIGYCIHEQEKILVYEYMPNGTLDSHLHKLHTSISWLWRLHLCIGISRGLRYLHEDTGIDSGVIHRDLKCSNILLHESWTATISDFGLSKTCPKNQSSTYVKTNIKGTFGYLDPNYTKTGKLTRRSDVYSFGVLLLEMLCRKCAVYKIHDEEWENLAIWAKKIIKVGKSKHIVDSEIRDEISPKCLKEFVRVVEACLHEDLEKRPTMAKVVVSLESVYALQEKLNMQRTDSRTLFGRMVGMLSFHSNKEDSAQGVSKLSGNSNGNNMIGSSTVRPDNNMFPTEEVPADPPSPSLSPSPSPSPISSANVKEFMFADLDKATRGFSLDMFLGEGGFGKVFYGCFLQQNTLAPSAHGDQIDVAVKRLNHESHQGYNEWLAEVNFLGQLAHPNIIRLFGYCRDGPELLLVYEYMWNLSFARFLFSDDVATIPWRTRLLIMIGVAEGLAYLHSINIILRDLKTSHILLDKKFNAKLGDFALAKHGPEAGETHVNTSVKGTFGYLDPFYYHTGQLTVKSDIHGFGVVLLESISGQPATDKNRPEGQQKLVDWAAQIQSSRRKLQRIMDPRLEQKYPPHGALACVELALRCVAYQPKDRPSSEEVLQCLKEIYDASLQEMEE